MKYQYIKGMKISELTLGTVQLGLNYSINSKKPDLKKSQDILKSTHDLGITTLDTAREYGDSEEIIGSFLKNYPDTVVVSKFKVSPDKLSNSSEAFETAYESVEKSKKALDVDKIPILLFHKGPEHSISDICSVIPGVLERLKQLEFIGIGGVSVFEPEDIRALLKFNEIEAFQVPVNIFDHRLFTSGVLDDLRFRDKIIFARSVFLKGLFFKSPEQIVGNLEEAVPYLNILNCMAVKAGISVAELAFSFVRNIPEITSLVFGADNPDQVRQNIELLQSPELSENLNSEIIKAFSKVPRTVIDPYLWNF